MSPHWQGVCVEQFAKKPNFAKCLQVFTGVGRVGRLGYLCTSKPGRTSSESFPIGLKEETAAQHDFQPIKLLIMSFNQRKISFFTSVLFTLFAITFSGFTAQSQELASRKRGTVLEQLEQNSRNSIVDQVISYAYRFRGTPYRYGASSPRGFDCSGFTSYVFKRFGIELDRSSRGQIFDGVRVKKNDLQPGDLVFFQGRSGRGGVGHVGIVTKVNDDNTFHFIHSACSSGVTESKNTEAYYSRRYVGACRVL